jgi:hypothetical protein
MICIDWWRIGREWYGAFPDCGTLTEDSAAKLKRSQLNVCTVYGALLPLWGWNLCQIGRQLLSEVDNSKVWGNWYGLAEAWMSYISQLASRVGGVGVEGELVNHTPYHYTIWLRERGGRGVAFPPLDFTHFSPRQCFPIFLTSFSCLLVFLLSTWQVAYLPMLTGGGGGRRLLYLLLFHCRDHGTFYF